MHCPEFLALYSDYRDGLIANRSVLGQVRRHLADCPRCRRYDAAIRWGVATLRRAELDVPPAGAWAIRAQDRAQVAEPNDPTPARYLGGLMLAAAFTLLVWEAVAIGRGAPAGTTAASPPAPIAIANPGVPFVRFVDHAASPPWQIDPPASTDSVPIHPAFTLYQPPPHR